MEQFINSVETGGQGGRELLDVCFIKKKKKIAPRSGPAPLCKSETDDFSSLARREGSQRFGIVREGEGEKRQRAQRQGQK